MFTRERNSSTSFWCSFFFSAAATAGLFFPGFSNMPLNARDRRDFFSLFSCENSGFSERLSFFMTSSARDLLLMSLYCVS